MYVIMCMRDGSIILYENDTVLNAVFSVQIISPINQEAIGWMTVRKDIMSSARYIHRGFVDRDGVYRYPGKGPVQQPQ